MSSKVFFFGIEIVRSSFRYRDLLPSGPVLRDTARLSQRYPPIARYGVFGVSTWPTGCDTPCPLFWAFPRWRACEVEVRYPPPSKGVSQRYLRDTLWKQGKWVLYPPLRYYLERLLRDRGVSRTGPLRSSLPPIYRMSRPKKHAQVDPREKMI